MGMPLGIGIPLGAGIPLGIGIPLGAGIPLGMGMLGLTLSIGIDSQHLPAGLGASGGLGASSACCCEAFVGPSVNAPEEPVQVPAKKLATAITMKANTAATVRLRSRSLTQSLLKHPSINFLSVEAAGGPSSHEFMYILYPGRV
jgi:hypothetical protein